ncbi:MAG: GDSL-type esterase/lipase family protein [Candidatus Magnetominusculus sp. LBB02]|nr:GDSL-type esterase/lipase family protein [Candidatus Magnetominusculus sp. LBB02]
MSKLTIVAFGDSLTVGFQSPTMDEPWYQETPYTDFLNAKIGGKAEFILKGISGELTEDMLRRYNADVILHKPDYVIILGGTNDLGWSVELSVIMSNLYYMYKTALDAGIIPVAVSVPSLRGYDPLIAPRVVLNRMIKENAKGLNIPFADYFTASCESPVQRLAPEYSNDGLHLSTEGYELLADVIYNEVFSKITL